MLSWLGRIASACWRPVSRYVRMSKDDCGGDDEKADPTLQDSLVWCKDLEKHSCGEFSFAVVQANEVLEDQSQVETGRHATFVGVYDGHGGPDASRFICDHLFLHLMILGSLVRSNKIVAEQLTKDHNASMEEVRQELRSLHPDDSHIVVMKHGVWRIKGIIQVSRSIGDAYLKRPEFSLDPSFPRFHLAEPLRRPVLTAEPTLCLRTLRPSDKFLIFASDGLWEHLSNQEAVEIVHNNPRAGIARRLLKAALNEAARKREMRYVDLKKVEKGIRRFFHDDITVVVIFVDHEMLGQKISVPELSVRGFLDTVGPSNFNILQGIDANARSII
ncbi:probable protein phosphatase 2C 25 isoform X2 [Syzygium oleosum]|uniref:probable protein phosphatase 2C 25 isoform X2 n=1 Tax=Syzygium oleosum TaxID=219896 RepID=UPI0024B9638B|nr:probable protein phosphatase 2C 25 isoform X2 [Syzygium oleosum]